MGYEFTNRQERRAAEARARRSGAETPHPPRQSDGPTPAAALPPVFDLHEMWNLYWSLCEGTNSRGERIKAGGPECEAMKRLFVAGAAIMFKTLTYDVPGREDGTERPDNQCEAIILHLCRQLQEWGRDAERWQQAKKGGQ
jgi:hypothetical protein